MPEPTPRSAREEGRSDPRSIDMAVREGLFRALSQIAPVMIWATDRLGRCVFVNEGWQRFSGRGRGEQLGEGWLDTVHPEGLLRQSERRYRILYDENPSMYFTLDRAGTVLSVNRFGAELLGYPVDEITGQLGAAAISP